MSIPNLMFSRNEMGVSDFWIDRQTKARFSHTQANTSDSLTFEFLDKWHYILLILFATNARKPSGTYGTAIKPKQTRT